MLSTFQLNYLLYPVITSMRRISQDLSNKWPQNKMTQFMYIKIQASRVICRSVVQIQPPYFLWCVLVSQSILSKSESPSVLTISFSQQVGRLSITVSETFHNDSWRGITQITCLALCKQSNVKWCKYWLLQFSYSVEGSNYRKYRIVCLYLPPPDGTFHTDLLITFMLHVTVFIPVSVHV